MLLINLIPINIDLETVLVVQPQYSACLVVDSVGGKCVSRWGLAAFSSVDNNVEIAAPLRMLFNDLRFDLAYCVRRLLRKLTLDYDMLEIAREY